MIIDLNSMIHIPAISYYNHNYYTIKESNSDSVLLVESRDDSHEHDVYVCEWYMAVNGDKITNTVSNKVFLGSATDSEGDDTVLVVELLRAYT
jgi:inorganic pyrophosphatase